MGDRPPVFAGCDCPRHRSIYQNWLQKDARIRVSSCMRVCPYCGKTHSNASRLRKHLRTKTYQKRNLSVEGEHSGVDGVRVPRCVPKEQKSKDCVPGEQITSKKKDRGDPCLQNILCHQRQYLISEAPCGTVIEQYVTQIQTLFGAPFGGLNHTSLCPLTEIPLSVITLWSSTTTSVPNLFCSSQCWTENRPSVRELVLETLKCLSHAVPTVRSESHFNVNHQGEVDASVEPARVIAQLLDPDPSHPAFLTGVRLPTVANFGFRAPYDLCAIVEPMEESNIQVNVTPKYTFVDLHIDYGADGLSTLVGDCRKIWLLYPPTETNMTAMKTVDGQRAKLVRIMHRLEGGIIVETTSAHAIHIPAGCIHATFTLQGGYLVAEDFTTSRSIHGISAYIASGLDKTLPPDARAICFDWFERCLDVCLAHQQYESAIQACVKAETHLASWASSHRHWRVNIRRLWEQGLLNDIHGQCPCGMQNPDMTLQKHLFTKHLKYLLSPSQIRRQA